MCCDVLTPSAALELLEGTNGLPGFGESRDSSQWVIGSSFATIVDDSLADSRAAA